MSSPQDLQQFELSQETRDLISTLPAEKGLISGQLHHYHGFWYPTMHFQGVLTSQKQFQAEDSDVVLASTPKSGTTWLKALLFALVKRVHYPNMDVDHPLLTNNSHSLVPFLETKYSGRNIQITDPASYPPPSLFSTHIPLAHLPQSVKDSACKIVYLCRNPKDQIVSLWHFTNRLNMETNSLEKVVEYFCRGISGFGPFWDHVLGYWKESLERQDKVFFIKYEEMKENPGLQLMRRLAVFLGCPFSPEEEAQGVVDNILRLCSFGKLSNLDVNKHEKLSTGVKTSAFFRRGEVGDWRNVLTAEMAEQVDRITQQKLQGSGLQF